MGSVASEMGFVEEEIVDFSEESSKVRGFLSHVFKSDIRKNIPVRHPTPGISIAADGFMPSYFLSEKMYETRSKMMTQNIIQSVSKKGNIVILGRGGQAILEDMPGILHVRIEAPLTSCRQRIQEEKNLSPEEAKKFINNSNESAARYLKKLYDVDWSDQLLYHLIINTGRFGVESAAKIIINAVSQL